jgi:hypothetical protein
MRQQIPIGAMIRRQWQRNPLDLDAQQSGPPRRLMRKRLRAGYSRLGAARWRRCDHAWDACG